MSRFLVEPGRFVQNALMPMALLMLGGGMAYLTWAWLPVYLLQLQPLPVVTSQLAESSDQQSQVATVSPTTGSLEPSTVVFQRLGISLDLKNGGYNPNSLEWLLNKQDAFSGRLMGRQVVYGHNTPAVFRNLHGAKLGEQMVIVDDSGRSQTYVMTSRKTTAPNDLYSIGRTNPQTVTVITCSGWQSEKRLLLFFEPASNQQVAGA